MIHKISEEWVLKLEQTLGLVTLKEDRLAERLNKIMASVDYVCQKAKSDSRTDIPTFLPDNSRLYNIKRLALKLIKR